MSEVGKPPPHKNRLRRRRDAVAKRMGRRDIARRGRIQAVREAMEELLWQP